jgi:hypothetical protein
MRPCDQKQPVLFLYIHSPAGHSVFGSGGGRRRGNSELDNGLRSHHQNNNEIYDGWYFDNGTHNKNGLTDGVHTRSLPPFPRFLLANMSLFMCSISYEEQGNCQEMQIEEKM